MNLRPTKTAAEDPPGGRSPSGIGLLAAQPCEARPQTRRFQRFFDPAFRANLLPAPPPEPSHERQ